LHPDGNAGSIDGVFLDKDGKERPNQKWQAIYQLKDDYLIICVDLGDPPKRPEKLTTSSMTKTTWLYILRRGKVK
jgi:uncharacterized protein (TIGR03067 family)